MATATETLRKIFRDIANAIRGKDGTTEADDKIHPENYASRIEAIETGFDTSDATVVASDILSGKVAYGAEGRIEGNLVPETGTDTSDATATAGDIVAGVTAYGPDGKITGTLPVHDDSSPLSISSGSASFTSGSVTVQGAIAADGVVKNGSSVDISVPASTFGNALATDVLSGKTFTSEAGLAIAGTLIPGTDTSDATATAGDIAKDKTAYGPDGKITGTLTTFGEGLHSGGIFDFYPNSSGGSSSGYRAYMVYNNVLGAIFRKDAKTYIDIPYSRFGNATAADVRDGKIFTSSPGYSVQGTMPNAGAISGQLGSTSGATWSTSDPNRGSGKVSITGVNQTAGYTAGYSNGTLSVTVPANRLLKGRTITPGTSTIKVGSAEDILYGPINVAGDSNLITSNIRSGVSIFGVRGSLSDLSENFKATVTFRNNSSDNTVRIIGNKNNGNPFDITVSPGQSIVMDVWFVGILIIIQDKLRGFNLSGTFLPDASNPFVNISFGSPLRYITLIRLNVTSGSFEFL